MVRGATFPSVGGIGPASWLELSPRTSRFDRAPSSEGIAPFSSFSDSSRIARFVKSPSSGGIAPFSSFSDSTRFVSWATLPSKGGIGPFTPLLGKSSSVTDPPSQVTPNQLHGSVRTIQPVELVQLGPLAPS